MLVAKRLRLRTMVGHSWPSMLYFLLLTLGVYLIHYEFDVPKFSLPFNAVATFSTALAIYLGFKNNQAYDRWWEARKIWGLLVNHSRAFAREIQTFPAAAAPTERTEVEAWKRRTAWRHMAFVNGLRVFLRKPTGYVIDQRTMESEPNSYEDMQEFLDAAEYAETISKRNPPNHLLRRQGLELEQARERGWLSDYRFVQMSQTLTEFNNHQGRAERIKNTPLPREYSVFSTIFVYLHGTLIPFAFVEEIGWFNIPLSMTINYVFLTLQQVGQLVEDPFENRSTDVPLSAISRTIEENIKEMFGEDELPPKVWPHNGVVF